MVAMVTGVTGCRDVLESDEGAYVCRAKNEGGYSEKRVWLLMQSKSFVVNQNIASSFDS